MILFKFNDLSKQAKIGYNALYNVVLSHSTSFNAKSGLNKFTVPLCLNADNKVSLTEKNFIFFESILKELNVYGIYTIVLNNGRAVDDVKTDFYTVEIALSKDLGKVADYEKSLGENLKQFDFSEVDTSKLLKRDGKAEKAKTAENKTAEAEKTVEAEKTAEALAEKTAEVENLKKEVAKKEEQLNKKVVEEFNDEALLSIANCVEVLIKKHCPIPSDFDFTKFECDLFKVIESKWDLKAIEK
jgi:hypothetical protein